MSPSLKSFTVEYQDAHGVVLWHEEAIGQNSRVAVGDSILNQNEDEMLPVTSVVSTDEHGKELTWTKQGKGSPFAPLP